MTDTESPKHSPSSNSPVTHGTRLSPKPLSHSNILSPSMTLPKPSIGSGETWDEKVNNIQEGVSAEAKLPQKKTPPKIAPKPKLSGGYVKFATDKEKVRGPVVNDVMESNSSSTAYSAPPSSSYVSSAKKLSSPTDKNTKDRKEPIDTIIFASIGNSKTDYISSAQRIIGSSPKSEEGPEPRLIPTGHVDYVMSAKPKSSCGPKSPVSPKSSHFKASSPTLNSALSPRKSKDGSQFKFSDSPKLGGSSASVRSGKDDQLTTNCLDNESQIDVVSMSQSAENVSFAPVNMETPLSVDVVHTQHASVSSNIMLEFNTLENSDGDFVTVDKIDAIDVDNSMKLLSAENVSPSNIDSVEGKSSSELSASVEVMHVDDGTKPCMPDVSLPANTDTVDINSSEYCSPDSMESQTYLSPHSSFPVAFNIS